MRKKIFFLPVSLPVFVILFWLPFLLLALLSLLELSPGAVLHKVLGLSVLETVLLYLAVLFAGTVNLPLIEFKSRQDSEQRYVSYLGKRYPLPVWHGHNTAVSVNLGGCVLAAAASLYLALPLQQPLVALSVIVMVLIVILVSKPSRSVGFCVPALALPLLSIVVALVGLNIYGGTSDQIARLAMVSGIPGAILGTTLMNARKMEKLSASAISIGGIGAFDGILLTGICSTIVACLLA